MKWLPKIAWKQRGGLAECPYFYRYILDFGAFSLRLHNWLGDDDHRAYHDHPYWFLTIVLKGGYTDVHPSKDNELQSSRDVLRFGSIRFRPAEFKHSVQDVIPGTWTFLVTGRPVRRWGFFKNGKRFPRDKWFAEHGHHPCDPANDNGVRIDPKGVRI